MKKRPARTTRPTRLVLGVAPKGISARREWLARELGRRGPVARQLLALFLVERMTPKEIGCALGLAPEDVLRHVRALLAELRDAGQPDAAPRRRAEARPAVGREAA